MQTVQMTIDSALLKTLDQAVKKLKTSRSAFARQALKRAIEQLEIDELEHKQRQGYLKKPTKKGELDGWEHEQAWGDK